MKQNREMEYPQLLKTENKKNKKQKNKIVDGPKT